MDKEFFINIDFKMPFIRGFNSNVKYFKVIKILNELKRSKKKFRRGRRTRGGDKEQDRLHTFQISRVGPAWPRFWSDPNNRQPVMGVDRVDKTWFSSRQSDRTKIPTPSPPSTISFPSTSSHSPHISLRLWSNLPCPQRALAPTSAPTPPITGLCPEPWTPPVLLPPLSDLRVRYLQWRSRAASRAWRWKTCCCAARPRTRRLPFPGLSQCSCPKLGCWKGADLVSGLAPAAEVELSSRSWDASSLLLVLPPTCIGSTPRASPLSSNSKPLLPIVSPESTIRLVSSGLVLIHVCLCLIQQSVPFITA